MSISKVVAGCAVNFFTPAVGVTLFALLVRRMQRAEVKSPPVISCFVLFATLGGWLLVLLTALFWEWSGMASLGALYLIVISPFVTAGMALNLHRSQALSVFHRIAYLASVAYSCLMLTLWLILITTLGIRALARS
jgi:hypothetical protein